MLSEETQNYFYLRLGELLKEARTEAGVKQEKLAEFLGLSRVSIVNIEQGKQKIQIHNLVEILNYLGVSISVFFEKLGRTINLSVDSKLEKKIKKEINTENIEDVNKIKEFINFSMTRKRN